MSKRDQTDAGNKYALKALKDKRAALAGQIVLYERKLAWAQKQIVHVDGCIELLSPGFDLTRIAPTKPYQRIQLYKQGELGRTITDALRRAGEPQTLDEVTTALIRAGGHGDDARRALKPRVRAGLEYLVRTGRVAKAGKGAASRWTLL